MIFNLVDIAHHYLHSMYAWLHTYIYLRIYICLKIGDDSRCLLPSCARLQCVRMWYILSHTLISFFSSAFKSYHFSPIIRFFSPRLSNALNSVTYKCTYVALHFFMLLLYILHTHILCTGSHIASYSVSKIEVGACINYVTYTLINGLFYI